MTYPTPMDIAESEDREAGTSSDCREFCCCDTYKAVGLNTPCPICNLVESEEALRKECDELLVSLGNAMLNNARLTRDLGETNDALAACQSQAGGEITWRDGLINEARELLSVMPDHGLSARDFALWNRRMALFLGIHLWVGPYGAVRWTHCQTCGVVQRTDGKNAPCRGPSQVSTREYDVTVRTSQNEREVERLIKDHATIIANKGKACVFCGAIGGEHHQPNCRTEGDKSDGATKP